MQIQKREYKTYEYDELSDEAKEKALFSMCDINVGYQWYMDDEFYYSEWSKETYGLTYEMRESCFDLDRGSYYYNDTIKIEDMTVFCKLLRSKGVAKRITDDLLNEVVTLSIDTKLFSGGRGKNIVDVQDYENVLSDADYGLLDKAANEIVEEFCEEMLSKLRKEYEYLTSREAIEDTIRANEYEFFEDGRHFTL